MPTSLLELISTPIPVLNSIGLNLRVGLSSEDPIVGRLPSEPYEAYLSVYSPEGSLLDRLHLGQIPPNRRRYFDISSVTKKLVPDQDHLVVAHRVPTRLGVAIDHLADAVDVESDTDYSMYRGVVEYSFPEGGNGSVIYETPPNLNAGAKGRGSSNTLSFTSQTIISDLIESYVVLINYSVNPSYANTANFNFALNSLQGERALAHSVTIAPFAIKVLDISRLIPAEIIQNEKDPQDGLSAFTFVGYSNDAALMVVNLSVTPSLGAVAVEHSHPSQSYLFPRDPDHRREVKAGAQAAWSRILSGGQERQ